MRRSKKGSLNLSINAIVVLILAITMLGLGLAFMRNIFGSATKEFEEVGGTVKKQMIDQMKESSKIIDISNPKFLMGPGEKKQVYIGFKNEGNEVRYFQIRQLEATRLGIRDSTNIFDIDIDDSYVILNDEESGEGGVCGSRVVNADGSGEEPADSEVYLQFKNTPTKVEKGEVVVIPMNIHSTSAANPGTCVYELKIDTDAGEDGGVTDPDYNKVIELTIDVTS